MSQASDNSRQDDSHEEECDCDDCIESSFTCANCDLVYRADKHPMRSIDIWETTYCTNCVGAFYKNLGRTLCTMIYHEHTDKDIASHLELEHHDEVFDARIVKAIMENNQWSLKDMEGKLQDLPSSELKRKRNATDTTEPENVKKQRTK